MRAVSYVLPAHSSAVQAVYGTIGSASWTYDMERVPDCVYTYAFGFEPANLNCRVGSAAEFYDEYAGHYGWVDGDASADAAGVRGREEELREGNHGGWIEGIDG